MASIRGPCGGRSGVTHHVTGFTHLYLKASRRLYQGPQVILQHIDFPPVHVGEKLLEVFGVDILQIHDGMLVWPRVEQSSEVGAAHGQDQLVGLKYLTPAGKSHVAELLGAAKILHNCKEARVVIIPLEEKLFLRHFVCSLVSVCTLCVTLCCQSTLCASLHSTLGSG